MSNGVDDLEQQADQDEQFRLRRAAANQPLETPKIAGIGPAPGPGVNLPGLPGPNPDVQKAHQRLAGLEGSSSGVDDPEFSQNHPIIHGIAKTGDVLGSIIAPGVTAHIPGTTLYHHAQIADAQHSLNEHEKAAGQEAQQAEQAAQTQHLGAESEALQNKEPDPEAQAYQSLSSQANPETGKPYTPFEAYTKVKTAGQQPKGATNEFEMWHQQNPNGTLQDFEQTKAQANPKPGNDFEQYYKDYLTENKFPDTAHNRLLAREHYAAAGQAPQRPQQQLGVIGGKVVELKPGMSLPEGSQSLSGELKGNKPTADEQRRADLANNLKENLNQLEDIVTRRPDLFGPAAGRLTSAREFVGTSDPDVAALKVIKEQMGMAMVGAHAMRNAQHVETAANSILNSFNNEPNAIKAAIAASRKSVGTFEQDVQNAKHPQGGQRPQPGAQPTGQPSNAADPLGIR